MIFSPLNGTVFVFMEPHEEASQIENAFIVSVGYFALFIEEKRGSKSSAGLR